MERTASLAYGPLAPYPWSEEQLPPSEQPLPFPVQPYRDPLYIPPTVHPTSRAEGDAYLRIHMVPSRARLHSELSNLTDVWVYSHSAGQPDNSSVPVGPTIEVQRGQRVLIEWINGLTRPDGNPAPHPVVAVRDLPAYVQRIEETAGVIRDKQDSEAGSERGVRQLHQVGQVHAAENLLGFTCGKRDNTAVRVPPWTVVHLHGGRTVADYDGWPETGYYPGQVQTTVYENNQPGTLLWYHDHGMAITRLNVYAGLAGLYLIRDPLEARLGLPCGAEDHEILLLIQDRSLTCEGDHPGISANQLLHKTGTAGGPDIRFDVDVDGDKGDKKSVSQAPMEFFGPLTLVNGRIWPRAQVRADVYRLRVLNGANARTYRLRFTDEEGNPVDVPLQMIGSDGGLLSRPVDLNDPTQHPRPGTITLASAERVDLLVDFRAFSGQRLELRNSAKSPFDGEDADPDNPLAGFLTYSQVMCFDVGEPGERHRLLEWDQTLLPSAAPWSYETVLQRPRVERLVALVEGDDGVLQLRECAQAKDGRGRDLYWDGKSPLGPTQFALRERGMRTKDEWESGRRHRLHRLYSLLPSMFSDTVHYLARDGDVEIWKFINLSPDSHPIHIHLVQFKVLARDAYSEVKRVPAPPAPAPAPATAGKATDRKGAAGAGGYEIHFNQPAQPIQLDEAERGWKDTVRVNPSEMATIAVLFRDYADSDTDPDGGQRLYMTGRYMYHCHILEHEDHEMMRPYVVMPPEVVDHMHGKHNMHGMHGADAASQAPGTGSPGTVGTVGETPRSVSGRRTGRTREVLEGWYMEPE